MEKKIENYLHLYLWQKVVNPQGQEFIVYGIDPLKGFIQNIDGENTVSISFLKLILRPLSDITDEESKEYISLRERIKHSSTMEFEYKSNDGIWSSFRTSRGIRSRFLYWNDMWDEPELVRWLLSKGFDLFGLIEAGLAIDKTKI